MRNDYRFGVRHKGIYTEILNSDHESYGGSHVVNESDIPTQAVESHGKACSIVLTLPPLATIYLVKKDIQRKT